MNCNQKSPCSTKFLFGKVSTLSMLKKKKEISWFYMLYHNDDLAESLPV